MKKWLMKRLKQLVARDELYALYRYRMACDLVRRWNADLAESAATGAWIHQVGEAERGFDIEDFRDHLRVAAGGEPANPFEFEPQPPAEARAQIGGEVVVWRAPVLQSPFGEWLDHGVRDGLVLVMHRGAHGWRAAGPGHAMLAHQIYVENVEPLCAASHEVAVVGLSGGGWRTVWARSDDDVTHPAPPSEPVGKEIRREIEAALRELDNTTAAEGSEDGIGCAENALRRALEALAQQPAAVDEAWRQKAAAWLEAKAAEQEDNNQRWPDHAAAYREWRDRPGVLRFLATQGLAAQQPAAAAPVGVEGFDAWFDEYTKNNYTDEMLAEAAWKAALAQQPAAVDGGIAGQQGGRDDA